jgi:hypothetical protein
MSTANRNDIRQLAVQIEQLAKATQAKLDAGEEFLTTSNELVRNSITFTFALGELYALEQLRGSAKNAKVTAKVLSDPNHTAQNYHNVRDARGRFTRRPSAHHPFTRR